MRTKRLTRVELGEFLQLLEAKRAAEGVAREAAKAFKTSVESLNLPNETVIITDGKVEVVANFNERNVSAAAARVDRFHNFNIINSVAK